MAVILLFPIISQGKKSSEDVWINLFKIVCKGNQNQIRVSAFLGGGNRYPVCS